MPSLTSRHVKRRAGQPRRREGFALPFLVLLIVIFIGLAAFAVDFSRMFLIKGQLQTAADAGAMAGALRMAFVRSPEVFDSAYNYTQLNLAERVAPEVSSGDIVPGIWASGSFTQAADWTQTGVNAVRVTTHHTADYLFGRIYGTNTQAISATAIGAVGSVGGTACVRPLAIPYRKLLDVLFPGLNVPVTYDLKDEDVIQLSLLTVANEIFLKLGSASTAVNSGNFYAVQEPPAVYKNGTLGNPLSGANEYKAQLGAGCAQYVISVGDWLLAEQGNMVGPTQQAINSHPGCVGGGSNITCNPPIPFIVPIWDVDGRPTGPLAFHVRYIGVFQLTGFTKLSTGEDGIKGYFSSMMGDGIFDPNPGPVRKPAIVR